MTDAPVPEDRSLLLDELSERLAPLRLLRAGSSAEADAVLESFGAQGKVEAEMLQQVASTFPIAHTDRFEDAHRQVMRALEVYDRNGPRGPSALTGVPPLLRGPAGFFVRILTRAIVRKYEASIAGDIRQLYAVREASARVGSTEQRLLARARRQLDNVREDFAKNPLPLPAFIGIGAVISGILSLVRQGLSDEGGQVLVLLVFILVGLPGFWCIVTAAGIARRRTRITLEQPLHALYEVMGDAGEPYGDSAKRFAILASLILFAVWIVLPILVVLTYNRFW